MDESLLLARARQNDPEALGMIYDAYSPRLYAYACRMLGDAQTSEECVGDTFYRFLRSLRSGMGPNTHLKAYLYQTAHNWVTDYYRRQPASISAINEDLAAEQIGPEILAGQAVEQERVRAALLSLTPDQRQVILLKFYEGWENEMIADALHKPLGAVKSLQHRALAALRRSLHSAEEIMYEPTE
jgi:RNA polymerase sigma-70 factor (ECF subfamily)